MYFGIVGERRELAQEALSYLHAQDIVFHNTHTITFTTDHPERLQYCAALIKRWKIINPDTFRAESSPSRIGVASKDFGSYLKKQHPDIKSFKLVDIIHTDKEIKELWSEIINIDNKHFGRVEWYQNIWLYETIDFKKPAWGMWVGMMPSKLALTLINIGIGEYENHREKYVTLRNEESSQWNSPTIRDPFCGFGTTNFLANYLWYHTIWSDINPTQAKQNRKRRSALYKPNTKKNLWTFIKHDVTSPFKSLIFHNTNIIISEWYLWHIVTTRTAPAEINRYATEVKTLYTSFAKNITTLVEDKTTMKNEESSQSTKTIIITIPIRLQYDISISVDIMEAFIDLGRSARLIPTPYSRPWQLVWRQVLIASIL